jgi:predicted dehydrogenase
MPKGYENVPGELVTSPISVARNVGDQFKIVIDGQEESVEMKGAGPEFRIANLAEAIQGNAALEVTGEDGLVALRVSLAAFESIETGRAVEVAAIQG